MSPRLTSLLLAAAEGGGGGLTDIDTTLFWSTLVLFGLFAFVLGKFAWTPLLHIIEEREKTVRGQVEGAEKASTEAQALLAKRQEMLKDATREREEMIGRATKEAELVKSELAAKARAEAEQIFQKAKAQIEQEKTKAISELRTQVADIAMAAADKIVRSSLTPEAQRKLVDETIAALPGAR
jgi:F-type H+-transporting ATPase subunit b